MQDDVHGLFKCLSCTYLMLPFEVTVILSLSKEKENLVKLAIFCLFYSENHYMASTSLTLIRVKLPEGIKMNSSKYSVIIALTKELNVLVIHCAPSVVLLTMRYWHGCWKLAGKMKSALMKHENKEKRATMKTCCSFVQ